MKFTDGYWQIRPGTTVLRARGVTDVEVRDHGFTAFAPTAVVASRGSTVNTPVLSVSVDSPAPGIIGVTIDHHRGRRPRGPEFVLGGDPEQGDVVVTAESATLASGELTATVRIGAPWSLEFRHGGRLLTSSDARSLAAVVVPDGSHFIREQLALGVGEHLYGLGERFGPFVKNGQTVDLWQADGGTSSEQAYKNVPFHLSDRGYGVFVDSPDHVSYEIASEAVSYTQFSVPGHRLRYYVIDGPTPADVLERYTGLTGRPARVPDWAWGLWLSTSFTTDYDERTVLAFVDGMAERGIPLSVFHFDCFWMRAFHWSDFVWDPATFPDPRGLIARLHERGLRVSVWINPYIAQRSHLFEEGAANGYLVTTPDGDVWQWDMWQAGMGLVDFTNPDAAAWFAGKLQGLLDDGVDTFKTDFGERIPTGVVWHDGSDPARMHNYYTHLYNRTVFDLLERERGSGEAVLFARSATAGGQQFPVHWGGDNESTFASMAETLRGGLSLAASGFGYWSHDIGGFEGTPDPAVFKRWVAFGLLSSHSRLHGSDSYRVPWAFDDEAVAVTATFARLKASLMPYLQAMGDIAHERGLPVLRPMVLEFPDDPTCRMLENQYMLGESLLVAPVFSAEGEVSFYLPEGEWTGLLTGERVEGPRWVTETHGFESLPLYVRPGSVIARVPDSQRPEDDHAVGLHLEAYRPQPGTRVVSLRRPDGRIARYEVVTDDAGTVVTGTDDEGWTLVVDGVAQAR